jgi:hypothetical protein
MTSALDDFTCLPKYRVVLCKICHYCVWPGNARTHFREKHSRLSKAERALICDELQAWQENSHSNEQFEVLQAVGQPIHGLRLFREGKQCRLEPVGDKTRDRRLNSHIVHHSTPGQCHYLSITRLRVSKLRCGRALSKDPSFYCLSIITKYCDWDTTLIIRASLRSIVVKRVGYPT